MSNQEIYGPQCLQQTQRTQFDYRPAQTVDVTPSGDTAATCVESLKKRADKLRSNLSFFDSWRAELTQIEAMLAAYETPNAG